MNAPGSENITTFLPANSAAGSTSAPPSGVACLMVTEGIFSPAADHGDRLPHSAAASAQARANERAARSGVQHPRRAQPTSATASRGPVRPTSCGAAGSSARDARADDAVEADDRAPAVSRPGRTRHRAARRRAWSRCGCRTGPAAPSARRICAGVSCRIAGEVRGASRSRRTASCAASAGAAASKARRVVGVQRAVRIDDVCAPRRSRRASSSIDLVRACSARAGDAQQARRAREPGRQPRVREPQRRDGGRGDRPRAGAGASGSTTRGSGSGMPSSSLIATDAAVSPNTDGTNATEPSTRFLCSQSLMPFWPPGHTHSEARRRRTRAPAARSAAPRSRRPSTPTGCVQSRPCLRRRLRRRSRANGSTRSRESRRRGRRRIEARRRAHRRRPGAARSRTQVAIRCILAAMLSIASITMSGSGTSSRARGLGAVELGARLDHRVGIDRAAAAPPSPRPSTCRACPSSRGAGGSRW